MRISEYVKVRENLVLASILLQKGAKCRFSVRIKDYFWWKNVSKEALFHWLQSLQKNYLYDIALFAIKRYMPNTGKGTLPLRWWQAICMHLYTRWNSFGYMIQIFGTDILAFSRQNWLEIGKGLDIKRFKGFISKKVI